jgi:hypothetical protein
MLIQNKEKKSPIVFVFIGDKLPKYVKYSLIISENNTNNPIYLVTNCRLPRGLNRTIKVPFESNKFNITDKSFFAEKKTNKFRDGFWNKTIQRYFLLYEFMKCNNHSSVFHVELDNLIFNLDGVDDFLDSLGKGAFYPSGTQYSNYGCGSFMYINKLSTLEKLINYIKLQKDLNDMQILGNFSLENSEEVFSINKFLLEFNKTEEKPACYADCLEFGLYIFGMDPRNTNGIVKNQYIFDSSQTKIVKSYKYKFDENNLYAYNDNETFRFLNVHVHSKIFRIIIHNKKLKSIISLANKNKSSLIFLSPLDFLTSTKTYLLKKILNGLK